MIDLRSKRPDQPAEFATTADPNWPPQIRKAHKRLRRAHEAIKAILDRGGTPTTDDFERHWKDYRSLFSDAQSDKCAYCESRFTAAYPGDVEHYRPKSEILELQMVTRGQLPRFKNGPRHKPGYWWLAYDFGNYLFSCSSCNNAKRNHFPVKGRRRRLEPGAEARELPRLINPFDVDPTGHFEFDELGNVRGTTSLGKWTVEVCNLRRENLRKERVRIGATIQRDIEDYEDAVTSRSELSQRQTLRRLRDACRPEEPYAAMARQLVEERILLTFAELELLAGD